MKAVHGLVLSALLIASPAMADSWRSNATNYCLDSDGRGVNGGAVRMWKCINHQNQTWSINRVGSNFVQVRNKASGLCLDTDGAKVNGGNVRMWACVNHPNQLWEIVGKGGAYHLRNKASGYCLDTDGAAVNGAAVRMWQCASHPHQTWARLIPIDD
jgi:hypothetical protein